MNGIIGMTDLVLATELTPKQRQFMEMAKISSGRLIRVLNDILDFSKIEAGKLPLHPAPFNLHETLETCLPPLAANAQSKGLDFAFLVETAVPEVVVGDAGRLQQILTNLVGNAIKFTKEGEIVIRVALADAGAASAQGGLAWIRFSVKDTGIGIAPEAQQRIFDAFSQADGSSTREYGGTGLGLSISACLAEMMGGRIWVESMPGQGSTFHIALPLATPAEVMAKPTAMPAAWRHLRALIVEEHAATRSLLAELLAGWLDEVHTAESWPVAMDALNSSSYDLVLLDAGLPASRLLVDEIRGKAGVILLVTLDAEEKNSAGYDLADEPLVCLRKPAGRGALQEALHKVTASQDAPASSGDKSPDGQNLTAAEHVLHILLVEDEMVNRVVAQELLAARGWQVTAVENGREAVKAAGNHHFDLVLMDVQMPEMDGLAATAAIRAGEEEADGHLPIIAMTAHALKGDREMCMAGGMDGYVAKPVHLPHLCAEMARVLGRPII